MNRFLFVLLFSFVVSLSANAQNVRVNGTVQGGGGGIGGSIADGQVAVGSGADTIGGSSALTWDAGTQILTTSPATGDLISVIGPATNWAESPAGTWTHTPGDTTALTVTLTESIVSGQAYVWGAVAVVNAGTVTLSAGGRTLLVVGESDSVTVVFYASDGTSPAFTPSSDFDGSLSGIEFTRQPTDARITMLAPGTPVSPTLGHDPTNGIGLRLFDSQDPLVGDIQFGVGENVSVTLNRYIGGDEVRLDGADGSSALRTHIVNGASGDQQWFLGNGDIAGDYDWFRLRNSTTDTDVFKVDPADNSIMFAGASYVFYVNGLPDGGAITAFNDLNRLFASIGNSDGYTPPIETWLSVSAQDAAKLNLFTGGGNFSFTLDSVGTTTLTFPGAALFSGASSYDFDVPATFSSLAGAGDLPACLDAAGKVYAGSNTAGVLSCP